MIKSKFIKSPPMLSNETLSFATFFPSGYALCGCKVKCELFKW